MLWIKNQSMDKPSLGEFGHVIRSYSWVKNILFPKLWGNVISSVGYALSRMWFLLTGGIEWDMITVSGMHGGFSRILTKNPKTNKTEYVDFLQ